MNLNEIENFLKVNKKNYQIARAPILKACNFSHTFKIGKEIYRIAFYNVDEVMDNKFIKTITTYEKMLNAHTKNDGYVYRYIYCIYDKVKHKWLDICNNGTYFSQVEDIIKYQRYITKYNVNKSFDTHEIYKNNRILNNLLEDEFTNVNMVGHCFMLCLKHNPINYYEFEDKYFKYAESSKNFFIRERGLTKEEFNDLALRCYKRCCEVLNNTIPIEDVYSLLYYHIIAIAFTGFTAEKKAQYLMRDMGLVVDKPDKDMDSNYGVDFIVYENEDRKKYKMFVQVKPISYFGKYASNKNKLLDCYKRCKEKFNVETYYILYERTVDGIFQFAVKNDGDIFLSYNDLVKNNIPNNRKIIS